MIGSAEAPRSTAPPRIRAFDGLRGVAALVVLITHCIAFFRPLELVSRTKRPVASPLSGYWWLIHSPLHLVWEGTGAVLVFFILSGFVVALPALHSEHFLWRAYYPQRLVRLYFPVWASIALAALMITVVPLHPSHLFLVSPPSSVGLRPLLKDSTLVGGTGGLNSPLWSLRWEIVFSLLLPVYVWAALRWRGHVTVKLLAILGVSAIGYVAQQASVCYLPIFLIGTIMAAEWPTFEALADRIMRHERSSVLWFALTSAGLLALGGYWYVMLLRPPVDVQNASVVITAIGAAIIVFAAATCPALRRCFETGVCQWLGLISFSLYLTHEPIVLALTFWLGDDRAWLSVPLAFVVSLVVAAAFQRVIEGPSHRLAQRLKGAVAARDDAARARAIAPAR